MKRLLSILLSALLLSACALPALASSPEIGETVYFGEYAIGGDYKPGRIEWIVIDKQPGKVLLISKYALDAQPYHESDTKTTWESCTLHGWLNKEFLNDAFSAEDQKKILDTAVTNGKGTGNPEWYTDGGRDTTDKVFLLSYEEVTKYFKNNRDRMAVPTEYAVAISGAFQSTEYLKDEEPTCWWWLRSPGFNSHCAAGVYTDGTVGSRKVNYTEGAVRPAIWVDLTKDPF